MTEPVEEPKETKKAGDKKAAAEAKAKEAESKEKAAKAAAADQGVPYEEPKKAKKKAEGE